MFIFELEVTVTTIEDQSNNNEWQDINQSLVTASWRCMKEFEE